MQQDEAMNSLWEKAALKLLKGKPLSSLTKVDLSGLETNVLYADRPTQYTTSTRRQESWSAVGLQGRVAGRFDTATKWTSGLKPTITRLYKTDDVSKFTGRVEIVGAQLEELIDHLQGDFNGILHSDPFARWLIDGTDNSAETKLTTLLDALQRQNGDHPFTIDTSVVFELGGTAKEELLWALLSLLEYANRGVSWGAIWLHVSADSSIVQTVVKFKALRQMMHGLSTQLNLEGEYPNVCAETSMRMFSRADEHNNMLRGLYAAVGAVWGGCDGLVIHGFDTLTGASEHAHRIAQNMHAVLKEESGLDNWIDPLFGSYQIESQTHALCTQVWTEFVSRSEGGLHGLLKDGFLERLQHLRIAKQDILAKQRASVTGVTAFADPAERLGTDWLTSTSRHFVRDVQQIEILRAKFESLPSLSVQIVCLGTLIDCKIRLEYLQQLLATVGLHGVLVEQWDSSASIRCLVGTDDAYESKPQEILDSLLVSGISPVWIVGRLSPESTFSQHVTSIYKGVHMFERWGEVLRSIDKRVGELEGGEQ